jgi:putative transposase
MRKRMRRREIPGGVRFITFSCQRRLPLLSNAGICRLLAQRCEAVRESGRMRVFAWVLMPEHVHLLCCPGDGETLEHSLRSIKMSVAKAVLARWAALNAPILSRVADAVGRHRFWQKGGGFDRNVGSDGELEREVRYIHRNPVERGLVPRPEDWSWSSVHWWMGRREGVELRCDPPPGDARARAAWRGFV